MRARAGPTAQVATDAVAGRTVAAFAHAVELVEAEAEEPSRLACGDQPEPIMSGCGARHDFLLEVSSLLTMPAATVCCPA